MTFFFSIDNISSDMDLFLAIEDMEAIPVKQISFFYASDKKSFLIQYIHLYRYIYCFTIATENPYLYRFRFTKF